MLYKLPVATATIKNDNKQYPVCFHDVTTIHYYYCWLNHLILIHSTFCCKPKLKGWRTHPVKSLKQPLMWLKHKLDHLGQLSKGKANSFNLPSFKTNYLLTLNYCMIPHPPRADLINPYCFLEFSSFYGCFWQRQPLFSCFKMLKKQARKMNI